MQPGCARSIPVTLRLVLRADERICQKWLLIRQKNISKRRVIHSKSSACSELLMRSLQQGLIVKMQTRSRREQPGKYLGNISCNAALGERASPAGAPREENGDGFREDGAAVPPLHAQLLVWHLKIIWGTRMRFGGGISILREGWCHVIFFAFERPHGRLALPMFCFQFIFPFLLPSLGCDYILPIVFLFHPYTVLEKTP